MRKFRSVLISVFFMFLLIPTESYAVCSNGGGLSRSKPDWADGRRNVIEELDNMVFIGMSTPEESEAESIDSAKHAALNEVSKYFGVTVESIFIMYESEVNEKVESKNFRKSSLTSERWK